MCRRWRQAQAINAGGEAAAFLKRIALRARDMRPCSSKYCEIEIGGVIRPRANARNIARIDAGLTEGVVNARHLGENKRAAAWALSWRASAAAPQSYQAVRRLMARSR